MEAPEKIYLNPIQDALTEMLSTKTDGDIEYIRKDSFIEKAKKWLYFQLNEINMEGEDMENFLKDFRKHME